MFTRANTTQEICSHVNLPADGLDRLGVPHSGKRIKVTMNCNLLLKAQGLARGPWHSEN